MGLLQCRCLRSGGEEKQKVVAAVLAEIQATKNLFATRHDRPACDFLMFQTHADGEVGRRTERQGHRVAMVTETGVAKEADW